MDPSELPGAEELYDEAPCGHLIAGPRGELLRANLTLCRWLGWEPGALANGQRVLEDLLPIGGKIFLRTHLQPLLRMQGSVAEVKLELLRRTGGTLPVLVNMQERIFRGQPLLHAAVFVAEDRHKYESELLRQRRRAEELAAQHQRDQEALAAAHADAEERAHFAQQLVGVVSHDIRNPLAVIHMSAVLLDRLATSESQRTTVARISRAVRRVQHLIGDLLDFTQARLGRGLPVRTTPIDLHQVVADSVAEMQVAFPGKTLLHERIGSGRTWGDPQRLAQAVGNLVGNAFTHGAADRPVTVTTRVGQDGCRIAVHNHGDPIPPATLGRLFEPMVRGEGKLGGEGGVGLGLYIVQQIARGHGGRAEVRSSAEDGTTFILVLPGTDPGAA